jgi:4-amino-4-deoxy-L-arabinose transferase-like glycosyltransferase
VGELVFGALLFAIALAPRLYVAFGWTGEPVWDGHYYDFGARRIAEGAGYSDELSLGGQAIWHPWCHYPVGYSGFLGFFYRVFGSTPAVANAVNATVGALLAVATWLLARHALSERRARVAGLLVAIHPGLVLYSALVMSEQLAALTTLVAFWLAVRDEQPRGAALGALVLGVSALVRPTALLCTPFLALTLRPWSGSKTPANKALRTIGAAAALSVLTLVPVLPWTARNCRVMDGCALVSTNAGWNLAIGAFPRATGRFETLRASDGCREVTGQVQQDRCWLAYGLEQIREHPGFWLSLVPAKLSFTFDHESFAVEYLREARPRDWPEERRVRVRDLTTLAHRLLVCAAALGCVAIRLRGRGVVVQGALLAAALFLAYVGFAPDKPTFWPLVLFAATVPWLPLAGRPPATAALLLGVALLGTTALAHVLFFGEDRYHMVASPVLCMLAAAALRFPATKSHAARSR